MTDKEIVQALRCTSTPGDHASNCEQCPYWKKERLDGRLKEKLGTDTWASCDIDKIGLDAADLIERLTAENAAPREKPPWKTVLEGNPKEKGCYLVTVKHWFDGKPVAREAFWNGTDWLSCEKRREITPRVTHWTPLPEVPEEGEKA